MREFAQALSAELKRREAVLEGVDFDRWRRPAVPRQSSAAVRADGRKPSEQGSLRLQIRTEPPVPRLVVLVDDFDALVAPALGSTGRPAAGSVVRALEAVARDGARLGVHLITVTGRPERTAETDADEQSRLRIALRTEEPESAALLVAVDDPAGIADSLVGRGYLRRPGGAVLPFQTGRITGRIPRTATLRPTVVPLEWERMGDPPARRTPRELGNGPTDLALLASALQRAADSAGAEAAPPLV
jgi:DNA segregation ATPase FtsK/SpoIIIE-like protein